MKLKTAIQAHSAIGELINLDRQNKLILHSSVRIRLSGALRKTRPVVEDFQEQNNALVTKYGTPVEGKEGQFKVLESSPEFAIFAKERKEALDTEVEVSFVPLETADLFGKTEDETKQNQVPIDLIEALMEVGLLKE